MHRKIVVIDGELAFVGGINFSEDHIRSFGAESKQDYAVEVSGPVVRDIHEYCRFGRDVHAGPWRRRWRYWLRRFPREMNREFNAARRQNLDALVSRSCEQVSAEEIPKKSLVRRLLLTRCAPSLGLQAGEG